MIAVLALAPLAPLARGEFVPQLPFFHSYIGAKDGRIRDTAFRASLEGAFDAALDSVNANYDDLVVTMGQCFGGGMLDDVDQALTSSLNSAARWYELSWSTVGPAQNRRGAYLDQWAQAINVANPPTMLSAATTARANDPAGPVTNTFVNQFGAEFLEHPQYTSSSAIGDNIKLRDSTPAKAILFGGHDEDSPWINFNSVAQIHNVLTTRYGYAEADIFVLYSGAADPGGNALPFVRDADTTLAGYNAAMTWLDGQATAASQPDVLYWNAQQHGSVAFDVKEFIGAVQGIIQTVFDLGPEFTSVYDDQGPGGVDERWLHVEYDALAEGNSLLLNGELVAELTAGSNALDIPLDVSQVSLSETGNTLEIVGPDTLDAFSALELGMTATGLMVPEPASIALLALGALGALRRRRAG